MSDTRTPGPTSNQPREISYHHQSGDGDRVLPVSPNFAFLEKHEPLLAQLPTFAESYFPSDPITSLMKLRQFGETFAKHVAALSGFQVPEENNQYQLLQQLRGEGHLTPRVTELLHGIRGAGNKATHDHEGDHAKALRCLRIAREVAVWFERVYGGEPSFRPPPFVPPRESKNLDRLVAEELANLRDQLDAALSEAERTQARLREEEIARIDAQAYAAEIAARQQAQPQVLESHRRAASQLDANTIATRRATASVADANIDLTESETRFIIDEQLREVGWEVDSAKLTHKSGARPHKSRNMAIAEWPTASGPADYALFIGKTLVGLIEAKRKAKDVPATLQQTKRYARDIEESDDFVLPDKSPWGDYKVPFLYATNGRPYLAQLETKSGIWFLDPRRKEPSRPLLGWPTPRGLKALLDQNIEAAESNLETEPFTYLDLRDYQQAAIRALESSLAKGQRSCLLAMATGTGKTRTALGLIYRLIKAGRFRRVLFAVDRSALGDQAAGAFQTVKLEQHKSFSDIYDLKTLGDIQPDDDTRLHIATIQGLMRRVLSPTEPESRPTIDQYDLIIVDECHRGYNLDRELSDAELEFRDEDDYISKYRRVIEYFDAVKIGLTATPALHTTQIFGNPVYTYGYRQAVLDGYLVDHEPPRRPRTRLSVGGIKFRAGDRVPVWQRGSDDIDLIHLPDDVDFEVAAFNRKVVTESFNRTICEYLASEIDPSLPGKTLIFCANREHADLVVTLLKQALHVQYGEVDDDDVVRITGEIDRPLQMIRRYKNEQQPKIAVTVDLLTTGVDVPEIVNLVFLRQVKSRILFEQMLGRATRLAPAIGKQFFRIYDCVDLYEALEPVSSMKPVVPPLKISVEQLVGELSNAPSARARNAAFDQLIAKLRIKARHIEASTKLRQTFVDIAQCEPTELVDQLQSDGPEATATWFSDHPRAVALLDTTVSTGAPVYISDHDDELLAIEHGYGIARKPEDYLASFKEFIESRSNDIPALLLVTQRPRELTRKALRELREALDQAGFTAVALRDAHRQLTNQEIAASIIGFIRQQALGEPLITYEERVSRAMQKILASRDWTRVQRNWLERIGKQIREEYVVDREALDTGAFREHGGYKRLNKIFNGDIDTVLGDLHEALWDQAS